ncbi:MAG: protein kinase [Polyangiaceae bacterium]
MVAPAEGTLFAERYRLIRELGGRTLGTVWEAEDERLERRVAVKIILPRLTRDPKRVERFERGAKAVAKLSSPHVVQLLDYGVADRPFMVMELLDGRVLREYFEAGQRFSIETAVGIVAQVAKALTAAHEAGIVHRKLEPGNIFIVGGLDDPFAKVFDFGTAKWLTDFENSRDLTTMGSILGAPDYVAPEQISGEERSDRRADVWSLAAIAYHLLTGQAPFGSGELGQVMRRILNEPPPAPRSLRAELPEDTDAFFEQALAKDREARFQTAAAFSSALCDVAGVEVGPTRQPAVQVARIVEIAAEPSSPPPEEPPKPEPVADEPVRVAAPPAVATPLGPPVASDRPPPPSTPPASFPASVPPGSLPLDAPSRGWLLLGAFFALAAGGVAAWLVFGSGGSPEAAPVPSASATPEPPPDESGEVVPADARSAEALGTAAPSAPTAPSASASAPGTASASASAAAAPTVPVPRWRPRDEDIYE